VQQKNYFRLASSYWKHCILNWTRQPDRQTVAIQRENTFAPPATTPEHHFRFAAGTLENRSNVAIDWVRFKQPPTSKMVETAAGPVSGGSPNPSRNDVDDSVWRSHTRRRSQVHIGIVWQYSSIIGYTRELTFDLSLHKVVRLVRPFNSIQFNSIQCFFKVA